MSTAVIWFLSILGGMLAALAWLLRGVIAQIGQTASDHAKIYAASYVKGAALIMISTGAAFEETFKNLSANEAAALTWWGWGILFWKPITAGLAVFVAFIDSSIQRARAARPE